MGWKCWWRGHVFDRPRGQMDSFCIHCGVAAPRYADLEAVTAWLVAGEKKNERRNRGMKI